MKSKMPGLGRTRTERATRLARRMWKGYNRYGGWWQFNWPRMMMAEAQRKAEA